MGGVYQHVVEPVGLALLYLGDLFPDFDHGIAETVKLAFALGFGGLDHQGIDYGEGHGGGMEAIIHQALGHILHAEAGALFQPAEVDNALMGDEATGAGVKDGKMRGQTLGHVVRIEDGNDGGLAQTFAAHHGDVGP